jgi:hypothetical protein
MAVSALEWHQLRLLSLGLLDAPVDDALAATQSSAMAAQTSLLLRRHPVIRD